ncbi:MAG: L-threonylcarbamoyladenylate synthase [Thermodesulfobacteriota bacterium]
MTKIIKAGDQNLYSEAADCLNNGGVIIYPTETLYGIGCLAFSESSCNRILDIKKRPENKGMILLVKDEFMLNKYFRIDKSSLEKYLRIKKPITLILETKTSFPIAVLGENVNVAVRISQNIFVKKLFNLIDQPITSTSANLSGTHNLLDIKTICKNFNNKVDLIIDSGSIPSSNGSAIVDLTQTPPVLIREGDLTRKDIKELING